jgi:hypothetical protein
MVYYSDNTLDQQQVITYQLELLNIDIKWKNVNIRVVVN